VPQLLVSRLGRPDGRRWNVGVHVAARGQCSTSKIPTVNANKAPMTEIPTRAQCRRNRRSTSISARRSARRCTALPGRTVGGAGTSPTDRSGTLAGMALIC
ncbi:MAG TPA: hypothetical protein VL961_02615, partial [Acidimicrobiales bacterium]|nr:hypothetical protein [Acidimicrobiales bacterium]